MGGGGRADMTCVSCNNVGMLVKVCVCCVCGGGCVGKVRCLGLVQIQLRCNCI